MNSENIYSPETFIEIINSSSEEVNQHFLEKYVRFVLSCKKKKRTKSCKTEKHHILPKSIFPEYKSFKQCKWNISVLSVREHIIAHYMLTKVFQNHFGLHYAFWFMTNQREYKNSKLHEKKRIRYLEMMSEQRKGQVSVNNGTVAKYIRPEEVDRYLNEGWILGRLSSAYDALRETVWIKRGSEERKIHESELDHYLSNGWNPGRQNCYSDKTGMRIVNNGEIKKFIEEEEIKKYLEQGWLEGSGKSSSEGTIWVHNGVDSKRIKPEEFEEFANNGYKRGQLHEPPSQKGRKRIHNTITEKTVPKEELEYWLGCGWILGKIRTLKGYTTINDGTNIKKVQKSELKEYLDKGWKKGLLSHPRSGTKIINNGIEQKSVKISELEIFIKTGWIVGSLPKK